MLADTYISLTAHFQASMARSNVHLLQEPPKSRQSQAVVAQPCPYATPPPSPSLSPAFLTTIFKHFGVLQPVSEGPEAKRAYYLRPEHLERGSTNPIDYEFDFVFEHIRWTWPGMFHCSWMTAPVTDAVSLSSTLLQHLPG